MRILITGVTSFLGIYTAEALLAAGHRVIGVVRPGSRNEGRLREKPGLARLRIAHFDFDNLPEAWEEWYWTRIPMDMPVFDAWIHFSWDGIGSAGRSDPAMQLRNMQNAQKAYVMANLLGCRKFLFAGSQAEYGRGSHLEPRPVSEYGKAKLEFGRWAREQSLYQELEENAGMATLHLRIFSVYGAGDHPGSLVNTLVQSVLRGEKTALGPCTQQWNYLEVRDLAKAIVLLTESPAAGTDVYDIAGGCTKPLRDYVSEIAACAAAYRAEEGRPLEMPVAELLQFGTRGNNIEGSADMAPDIRRLEELGFREEIDFQEGIRELCRKQQVC